MSAMFYPEFLNPEYAQVMLQFMVEAVDHHRRRCKLCKSKLNDRCRTGRNIREDYEKIIRASGYNFEKGV